MRSKIRVDKLNYEIEDHNDGTSTCHLVVTLGATYSAYLRHLNMPDGNEILRQSVREVLQDHIVGDIEEAFKAYDWAVRTAIDDLRRAIDPRRLSPQQMMESEQALDKACQVMMKTLEIYE